MRIALVYPPPWKIAADGAAPDPVDGPPPGYRHGDLDADFYQTPYGLFALGAAAKRAGHSVKVLNLSSYAWERVEEIVRALDADVLGMSCWTANRRGVALVAALSKKLRPRVPVVVGGPHATPLAKEVLAHHRDIDAVCLGESDATFLELVDRVARGEALAGLAGALVRSGDELVRGPERPAIEDLDSLACVHEHFATHIVMTSRGCPWQCTFCGADTTWGRGFRGNSVEYVLDELTAALARLPVKMIQIKDDTFTTSKKRVLALCRGIRERGLRFFWSCDTRVDLLTDELVREMRLAGCERLSLGVESGSQRILDAIDKKITVAEIEESTELAKRYGVRVRYYMMLGNRGETRETFAETLAFLERAKPHQYVFSCLSVYPGTRDFKDAEKAGWLDREAFFRERFQELKTPFDASDDTMRALNAWFEEHSGLRETYREGVAEYEAILARLGDHHAAHLDLAGAYYDAGRWDDCERHARRALELGYPSVGLVYNYLACLAHRRGDVQGLMDWLSRAAKEDPQHFSLIKNVNATKAWFAAGGPAKGLELVLTARHDFQLLERTAQPTLPGPLAADFATWGPADLAPAGASARVRSGGMRGDDEDAAGNEAAFVKTPDVEGSRRGLEGRGRLKVLP
ncbi:MAG TPA: radical SAM protein [Byssovorax sp.]|jgi:radical SAM superfamily enzyme YgiQ (UPF0313 family)